MCVFSTTVQQNRSAVMQGLLAQTNKTNSRKRDMRATEAKESKTKDKTLNNLMKI
jgi:hypothetical protein